MFIERFYPLVNHGIEEAEDALTQTLPDSIRAGIEDELRKLKKILAVLNGEEDESIPHRLRAQIRWAKKRLEAEKDPSKKKVIEKEIAAYSEELKREIAKAK